MAKNVKAAEKPASQKHLRTSIGNSVNTRRRHKSATKKPYKGQGK